MTKSDDPRFHRTLFSRLADYDAARPPALYYVENGNFFAGYDQLAGDYKMAADLLIATEQKSGMANWIAPTILLVRQAIELSLKALLEATVDRGNNFNRKLMFSHDLAGIWGDCKQWLERYGCAYKDDARFDTTEWMIENFHAVDPAGDLFRFAHSKHEAFGRHKSYDRVGMNKPVFSEYFEDSYGFLRHWTGVLVMDWMAEQAAKDGMEYTRLLDPNAFPRRA